MYRNIFRQELTPSGLVIAGIGFALSRFTVALSVHNTLREFLFAGLLPLLMGLGIAAFGVALSVGAFPTRFVRTVTVWTLIGTGTMSVLVISTVMGSTGMAPSVFGPGPVLSNFLIGGGAGGAIVGVYAARNRQNRDKLRHHANRLATLNRILRDQVLNAVSIIKGHASILEDADETRSGASIGVISQQSEAIEASIEEVGTLTRTDEDRSDLGAVDLETAVAAAIDQVSGEFPDVDFASDLSDIGSVYANDRLDHVFYHLLDNAARYNHTDDPAVRITAEKTAHTVVICVEDNGPGLPQMERDTLETGSITKYDDPRSGFGLNIVRMLVESYGGTIRTEVDDGTTIEIELARGDRALSIGRSEPGELGTYGVQTEHLSIAVIGALVAGAAMGVLMQAMVGIIPVIGALYGVQNPIIGWVTHQFHSVVFGMIYALLLTVVPRRTHTLRGRVGVAIVFAVFLWLFAAGIVMPIWLQLLGFDASLPNLTGAALVGHLVWGITLGGIYHVLRSRWESVDPSLGSRFENLG